MAQAVIVLDEAQTLPVHLLRPCLAALDELARNYGASIVLCTATQPALRQQDEFKLGLDIPPERELAPNPPVLYSALKRVSVEVRPGATGDDAIVARFAEQPQMLCIVNSRAHARTLFTAIRDLPGATHLTTLMCPRHRQLVLHTLAVTAGLALAPQQGRLHRDDVYMPLTPMFHVHAWGLPYVATMAGLKQVYPGRYVPDTILKLIDTEKVTFSHCVPTILHMVLSAPAAKDVDLSKWKMIIGGSAMTSALAQTARERGIDVFTGYGMSETCPILSLAHVPTAELGTGQDVATRVKTGRPIPLVALRTVDADMNDCPHDGKSTGEVVVRAPWLTQGYLHNPEASQGLWEGGWLHTQDIGNIDARGYLQVTDRIKDVIKTGGEWVSSLEIEEIIARHPAVAEIAVIGVKDAKWGERPVALVVLKADQAGKIDADDIRKLVLAAADDGVISKYGVPDRIEFVRELARTSVGKLNKRVMREQYPS